VGVRAELIGGHRHGDRSIELALQVFAELEGGGTVVAHPDGEAPRLMLGLRDVDRDQRLTFVKLHLREAYLDPVSGDPTAWRALIAALGDEGLSYGVPARRVLPFSVELGPRLTAALG
jgi:hypothetical protein